MKEITRTDHKILKYIDQYKKKWEEAPFINDIAEEVGITIGGVDYHLKRMQDKGLITRIFKKERSLNITSKGRKILDNYLID